MVRGPNWLPTLSLPNEDVGRMNKRWNPDFRVLSKGVSTQFGPLTVEKCFENPDFIFCSSFQNLRLGSPNTFFFRYRLFLSMSLSTVFTRLLPRAESATFWRGNFMLPKRRFWKEEQKMKSGFSTDFSMEHGPNWVLTSLKSALRILISSFVPPSKIFVWEGYNCSQWRFWKIS